ncbi:hypothetical protein E4U56_007371 [Claviceps arundinis]|uniref:H/ACA ribonucleoprotein complex non-core subunit NAF1 n=1 Tax=Claviceps arundinis TaxID=1623583 RepID=A0A9P7MZ92_9HYPO|nr:hypothetical protein E4U56_007371 [Claviceps arundinis]
MSGFQIPGLGQAKPNEVLPPLPTDVLVAAASVGDVPVASHVAAEETIKETTTREEEVAVSAAAAPQEDMSTGDAMNIDEPDNTPSLTGALEAAIGGLDTQPVAPGQPQPPTGEAELQNDQGEHPEWEVDSSPYQSSDSDSSDSSDSDSSDQDSDKDAFELLGVEEMGRLLMEAEGGSEDEGDRGKGSSAAQLRTKNEIAEEILPKPDVVITEDMKIEELGSIENMVDTIMLIKAITPGEYQVLDTGSVLCTAQRKVIGVVAETIGKVLQPMYTVYFRSVDEIRDLGLEIGTKIFYPVDHASYVFTEPLKNLKGSDASNIHDEEVGDEEMEFSDDEKEAEYKKAKKQQRQKDKSKGKNSTGGTGGQARGPHPLSQQMAVDDGGLNYDDDDGPYKPLTRPPGFGSSGSGLVSSESTEPIPRAGSRRGGGGGRGGDSRGRGGRGRGSSRGGNSHHSRGGVDANAGPSRDGYALPPQGYHNPQASYPAPPPNPAQLPNFGFQFPPGWPMPNPAAQGQPASATAAAVPLPPPGWPVQNQGQPAPGGAAPNAFLNPALLAALMSQMQQQGGQQGWGGYPQQPPHGGQG